MLDQVFNHGDGDKIEGQNLYVSTISTDDSGGDTDSESLPDGPSNPTTKLGFRQSRSQEAVTMLLSSFGPAVEKCADEFHRQEIQYKDLASLCDGDLKLLGIKDPDTREEMLETFALLPSQAANLSSIRSSSESAKMNEDIIRRALIHLNAMATSLRAASLKMRIDPAFDVLIKDNEYASQQVLRALIELKKISSEIQNECNFMEAETKSILTEKQKRGKGKFFIRGTVFIGFLSAAAYATLYIWKRR